VVTKYNFVDYDYITYYIDSTLNGNKQFTEELLAIPTLEIWLRRLFDVETPKINH